MRTTGFWLHGLTWLLLGSLAARGADADDYHLGGDLAGSLKSSGPLPVYDDDPQHLWNRLFAAFYTRERELRTQDGRRIKRIEGGDYIDFLAWGGSEYWSRTETTRRLTTLLDEFLNENGVGRFDAPLKRALLLRDLWAAYDFFAGQNMRRVGDRDVRQRRDRVAAKLALVIQSLAPARAAIAELPDTYAAAIRSGAFAAQQDFETNNDYLPHGLLTNPDQWVEVDFHQPDIHEDLYERFLTLHARAYRGRSYFRVFYRFPGGRPALASYLLKLEETGIDWRQAAQNGFILLKQDAPQIPAGTEVALVQFMMALDDAMRPTPTRIVESVRHRVYRNTDGRATPPTNTGVGMHVQEYTLKRRLLLNNLERGGLVREPDALPLYRVIFQPADAPDWGTDQLKVLFQQCADCHMSPSADRTGVHSMPSIVHMGGFDAGAQLGVVHPLDPRHADVHGRRVARWKTGHETFRRLLEHLDR